MSVPDIRQMYGWLAKRGSLLLLKFGKVSLQDPEVGLVNITVLVEIRGQSVAVGLERAGRWDVAQIVMCRRTGLAKLEYVRTSPS